MTQADHIFRLSRLSAEILVPVDAVSESLSEPVEIVRWLGSEAWGIVRMGGTLDLVLGAEDLGEERATPLRAALSIRQMRDGFLEVEIAGVKNAQPLTITITLDATAGGTRVVIGGTAFDASVASEAVARPLARAAQFHLANLKSILEGGRDLRETAVGELFRFEGTALARRMRIARSDVRVGVSLDAAFRAFVDADSLAQWWPGSIDLPVAEGVRFEAVVEWNAGGRAHAIGTVARWNEPESVRLEWSETTAAGSLDAAALLAFLPEGDGTRVVVLERSDTSRATWTSSIGGSLPGWNGILARFARHIRGH